MNSFWYMLLRWFEHFRFHCVPRGAGRRETDRVARVIRANNQLPLNRTLHSRDGNSIRRRARGTLDLAHLGRRPMGHNGVRAMWLRGSSEHAHSGAVSHALAAPLRHVRPRFRGFPCCSVSFARPISVANSLTRIHVDRKLQRTSSTSKREEKE